MTYRSRFHKSYGRKLAAVALVVGAVITFACWILSREQNTGVSRHPEAASRLLSQQATADPSSIDDGVNAQMELDNQDSAELGDWIDLGSINDLLAILREKVSTSSPDEILAMLKLISESRPEDAVELAQRIGRTEEEKAEWVTNVTRSWAGRNPDKAWQWFAQLGTYRADQLAGGSLLSVILEEMAAKDPEMLLQNADALLKRGARPNSVSPQVMVATGMEALIKSGSVELARSAIEKWSNGAGQPVIGAGPFQIVAMFLAKTSPDEAADWLKSLAISEDRNSALAMFAARWAERDPAAAMRWSESIQLQDGQLEVRQRAFSAWAELKPADAAQWLDDHRSEIQAGPQTDQMVASLLAVSPMARTDPVGALQWASLIIEPTLRADVIEGLVKRWGRADPAGAVQYLQQTADLTAQQKASVLQSIRDPDAATDLEEL
jgi:hypothetical protein